MDIISRAAWGAAPPRAKPVPMKLPAKAVWLHHTVSRVSDDRMSDVRLVQDIAFSRKFSDISYSWLVDVDGNIYEGRGFSVGAHTSGLNSTSFGVALIGDYSSRVVMDAQVAAVRWLVAWLQAEGALGPGVYPTGGHRSAPGANTACPGEWAMKRLPEMQVPWADASRPTGGNTVVIDRPPVRLLTHPAWPPGAYMVVADDGGAFHFGGAPNHGSLGGTTLAAPIVDAGVTDSGQGYWMLGRDGGVFAFGDAPVFADAGRVEWQG